MILFNFDNNGYVKYIWDLINMYQVLQRGYLFSQESDSKLGKAISINGRNICKIQSKNIQNATFGSSNDANY